MLNKGKPIGSIWHTQKQKKYHKEKMKWVSCQRLLDTNKMGNKNVQLAANDLKIQHHGILSTFNDTIKSQYTDGFKANRFVISNSRKEPDANGTNGWGTGAIDRNLSLIHI